MAPSAVSRCTLKFPDDTEVMIIGLDEIMTELFYEGRKANDKTALDIIKRLEEKKNYIPSSERVHREYSYVLLKEYRKYLKDRSFNGQ